MRIQSCEYPKRIYNKYIREYMYVPCGKCNTCRCSRSFKWVQRLRTESRCHQFVIFFTLTYSDDNVPTFKQYCDWEWISNRNNLSINADEYPDIDDKSITLLSRGFLHHLYVPDAQNFVKRLRNQIYAKFKNQKEGLPSFRYYICGEYGPSTYRPHMHGLLFFDDVRLKRSFDELFHKAWSVYDRVNEEYVSIGRTDWSFVSESGAAQYVAQYVNSFSHLPKVLATGRIKPFAIFSRRPPLGSLFESSESVQEIFDKGLVLESLPQEGGRPSTLTPILPYLKNRLFPKCLRFDKISHTLRIAVYRFAERFFSKSDAPSRETFNKYVKNEILKSRVGKRICKIKLPDGSYVPFPNSIDSDMMSYLDEISDGFKDFTPIYRTIDISFHVIEQAKIFGCSVEYYVSRIELYESNKSLTCLSSWYRFAEEYTKTHSYFELLSFDIDFLDTYVLNPSSINSKILEFYGLDSFPDCFAMFDYTNTSDYKEMKFMYEKIYRDTSKTKKKNDYLLAHPELSYFNNI